MRMARHTPASTIEALAPQVLASALASHTSEHASAGAARVSAEAASTDEIEAAEDLSVSSAIPFAAQTIEREHVAQSASWAAKEDTTQASAQQPTRPQPVPAYTPEPAVSATLALPPDSDLVMIETRFAPPPVESDEPVQPRPHRERRTHAAVADEPLQLVETRKGEASP